MFNIGLVIFRECLEASILVSIISASMNQLKNFRIYLTTGIILGLCSGSVVALFINQISQSLNHLGDEILDITVTFFTIIALIWTILWVQVHTKQVKSKIADLSEQITNNSIGQTMLVVTIAGTIFREFSEVILFVHGIASSHLLSPVDYIISIFAGGAGGIGIGYLLYSGLLRVNIRNIFSVLNILLTMITGGLSAKLANLLHSAGFIESFYETAWDTSNIVSNTSILGRALHITVGYNASPTVLQIMFYLSTVLFIIVYSKMQKTLQRSKVSA